MSDESDERLTGVDLVVRISDPETDDETAWCVHTELLTRVDVSWYFLKSIRYTCIVTAAEHLEPTELEMLELALSLFADYRKFDPNRVVSAEDALFYELCAIYTEARNNGECVSDTGAFVRTLGKCILHPGVVPLNSLMREMLGAYQHAKAQGVAVNSIVSLMQRLRKSLDYYNQIA